jgi:folate-dependent phosphoribosylglycinamide formyltransferase PurN
MRTLLVTSSVTFVPENYNRLVCGLADHPSVVGLLELDNREKSILLKGFGMMATMSAPRMGATLVKNYLGSSRQIRKQVYESRNKFYEVLPNVNDPAVLELIKKHGIDLIVNARTRAIFKKDILNATRLGCINIHHGLLPEQRGLMCDFWAHLEGETSGFSIHQMTSKIDDGPILHVQPVSTDSKSYMSSLLKASEVEAKVGWDLLNRIKEEGKLSPLDIAPLKIKYRKNPSLVDGYKLQLKGIKI